MKETPGTFDRRAPAGVRIRPARFPRHRSAVRQLFREYANWLNVDLCFQDFESELANLPGPYAAPEGRLLLAIINGAVAGCVALRDLGGRICEMKRLYVQPAFQRRGIGLALAQAVIRAAQGQGYRRMRLDTLASLTEALRLYEKLGFQATAPYYDNPLDNVVFLELDLGKKVLGKAPLPASIPGMTSRVTTIHAGSRMRVPPRWRKEVVRVLITEQQIAKRVRAMSNQIQRDFAGREMVIVSLLNGTVMFLADLVRHISLPLRLDFIGVSSYRAGTTSGELVFTKELRLDVRDRDVLLVDDILDTGRTVTRVRERLQPLGARSLRLCVLLDKPARRQEDVHADYVGFSIPDKFVVGYGLDYAERYRNLPFVGVLHESVYREAAAPLKTAAQRS